MKLEIYAVCNSSSISPYQGGAYATTTCIVMLSLVPVLFVGMAVLEATVYAVMLNFSVTPYFGQLKVIYFHILFIFIFTGNSLFWSVELFRHSLFWSVENYLFSYFIYIYFHWELLILVSWMIHGQAVQVYLDDIYVI